ncbi:hypothetical protein [Tsukamurella strandjordii]|uniref:Glycerophosphoryl diester phosphodiesterase membrane domain-containing protein n=1 Tax=Tsukamurella strandjordii TaxID=147577 RepID=A0AA90N8U2_9ACTN|nr:hypothetical protein [Tsukamurella strandjordii]MDP0397000.1 hypothetical protein [Tsukamurella strandjordii]
MTGDEAEATRRRDDDDAADDAADDAVEAAEEAAVEAVIALLPPLIPLAPLRIVDLFLGAVHALRANPRVMFGLTAVIVAVMSVVSIATQLLFVARGTRIGDPRADADVAQVLSLTGLGSGWSMANSAFGTAGTLLVTGVVTISVARAVLGRKTHTVTALLSAGRRMHTLVALGVLDIVLLLLPVAAAVAVAILGAIAVGPDRAGLIAVIAVIGAVLTILAMWPFMAIATSVVMLERRGSIGALSRAFDLQRPGYRRILSRLVLSYLIAYAIGIAVWLPFWYSARWLAPTALGAGDVLPTALIVLGSAAGQVMTLPFLASVNTLLYVDQRIRNEELGPELERAAADTSSSGAVQVWMVADAAEYGTRNA